MRCNPSTSTASLVFIIAGFNRGDPHFDTQDGFPYTFNGLGEYWLVKCSPFEAQIRTERAWSSNFTDASSGTVFGAIAAHAYYEENNVTISTSIVFVEMPFDRVSGTYFQHFVLNETRRVVSQCK